MSHAPVKSPVAPSATAQFVESLATERILERYQCDYGLDVADYFTGLASVSIYACPVTGYRFYYPFTLAGREDLYAQLAERFDWYYADRPEHAIVARRLAPSDRVIEIGCGRGLFLKRLAANGIRGIGLDTNANAIARARAEGLDVRVQSIEEHASEAAQAYDLLCAFHVLEHIAEARAFLLAALRLLRPGGRLALAVPNSAPYFYGFDRYFALNAPPHHMGLWDRRSLRALTRVFPLQLEALYDIPMEAEEFGHYLVFSLPHSPVWVRKRDWLLWRLYQRCQERADGAWLARRVAQLMTRAAIPRNLLAIFRRQ